MKLQSLAVYICILAIAVMASSPITKLHTAPVRHRASVASLYEEAFVRQGFITKSKQRGSTDLVHQSLNSDDTLTIVLFENLTVRAVKTELKTTKEGGLFWKGECIQGEDGYIILYYAKGLLSGTLYSSDVVYNLNALDASTIRVVETNPTLIPDEHKECTHDHPERAWSPRVSPTLTVDYIKERPGKEIVDVLILYPPSIESQMGGKTGMTNEVHKRIAEINDIFDNSNIACEFNLAHHQPTTAVSSGAQGAQDVVKSEVISLRNQYKADIVSFWSGPGGSAGSGFNLDGAGSPDDGFNTSKFSLVQTYFTFVHESGHNMGAKHDRAAYGGKPHKLEVTPYYRYGKSFGNYRSVMSYNNCTGGGSCPRVPYFTNPNITVKGAPFGVEGNFQTYDVNGPADNARRLNGTASIVAKWLKGSTVPTYNLTVSSGSGDGQYTSGASVTITAAPAPDGKVFDQWTGDTQYLSDAFTATTTVTMPSKDITLTATYKTDLPNEYTLIVESGSGDGTYLKGATVTVSADDSSSVQKQFTTWSGDTAYLTDVTSATTTVTMPERDIRITAQYELIEDIDSANLSINLVQYAGWEGVSDTYGSAAIVDTSKQDSNEVRGEINLIVDNATKEEYSWAKISAYLDSTFDDVSTVKVRYKADKKIALVLEQPGLSDSGVAYSAEIPAQSSLTTLYIPISRFKQPKWEGSHTGPLKLNEVSALSLEAKEKGTKSSFTITELQFTNFEYDPVATLSVSSSENRVSIQAITSHAMRLQVPQSGTYHLKINRINGQELLKRNLTLKGGVQQVAFNTLRSGVYLVRLEGTGGSLVQKVCIK